MPLRYERPSDRYMRELFEVARDASALANAIASANLLPQDFPTESIEALCSALSALPEGTAEGSLAVLVHAQARLPAWRNQFLYHADDVIEEEDNPKVHRGGLLDETIKDLYGSIGSAIECYKLESGSDVPTDIEPEARISEDEIPDRVSLLTKFGDIRNKSEELKGGVTELAVEPNSPADLTARLLTDTKTYAASSESEVMQRQPRVQLMDRLSKAGVDVCNQLEDIVVPMFQSSGAMAIIGTLTDLTEIQQLAAMVAVSASGLKILVSEIKRVQARRAIRNSQSDEAAVELPYDPQMARSMVLNGEAPPEAWTKFIVELDLASENAFADLNGVRGLSSLRRLILNNTAVSDLQPLQRLEALEELALWGTPIRDLAPLVHIPNLRVLHLGNTDVSDLSPLKALEKLRQLTLHSTQVKDVSPLEHMVHLEGLDLAGTQVVDLSSLSKLRSLQLLNLTGTPVRSVAALRNLPQLQQLFLSGTRVRSVSPLSELVAGGLNIKGAPYKLTRKIGKRTLT